MRYLIFSDLANTLCNNSLEFTKEQVNKINNLINDDIKLIILTEEPFDRLIKLIKDNNLKCDFYSTDSLIGSIDGKIIENRIPLDSIEFIFKKYKNSIYTSYLMDKTVNNVINHLDRLENIYPNNYEVINSPIVPPSEVVIAIDNNALYDFEKDLEMLSLKYKVLGADLNRTVLKIARIIPTKENIFKLLANSFIYEKTIGIGDSYCDYDFIKHCDIKLAVKSNDNRLQALCDYNTTSDDVINILNDICHFKKV